MRLRSFLGAILMTLSPTLAFAQATDPLHFTLKTTHDLQKVCGTKPDDPLYREAINFCQGFVLATVSYHDAVVDRRNLQHLICYPPTATREDGIRAFIEWASSRQSDQKLMDEPPVYGMVRGLAAKWPCRQG